MKLNPFAKAAIVPVSTMAKAIPVLNGVIAIGSGIIILDLVKDIVFKVAPTTPDTQFDKDVELRVNARIQEVEEEVREAKIEAEVERRIKLREAEAADTTAASGNPEPATA